MEPLRQAPQVIPQLILSLCAISIMTFNKLSEVMTPFYGGNKNRPRINVTTGEKTFNWLFDTGAAVTCMNDTVLEKLFLENDLSYYIKVQDVLLQTDLKWILWVFLSYQWQSEAEVFNIQWLLLKISMTTSLTLTSCMLTKWITTLLWNKLHLLICLQMHSICSKKPQFLLYRQWSFKQNLKEMFATLPAP